MHAVLPVIGHHAHPAIYRSKDEIAGGMTAAKLREPYISSFPKAFHQAMYIHRSRISIVKGVFSIDSTWRLIAPVGLPKLRHIVLDWSPINIGTIGYTYLRRRTRL